MPLWAKIDVDMPEDGKLYGASVVTRHLWTCLICLAKKQDDRGAIRGFDCALLAGRFNLPRKAVADALTHYQAHRMVELDTDGTIRLVNFDKRQGREDTANERQGRYYDSHREEILAKKKSSRTIPHGVLTLSSREDSSLEQSRVEKEEEQNRAEKSPRSKSLEATTSQGVAFATAAAPRETQSPTSAVWDAYSDAYQKRYGEAPSRNKKINGQLANLITRIPRDEAPGVAAFYVTHSGQLYVRSMHCVDLLLRDIEALRTQWVTGRKITDTRARQEDRTAANAEGWAALLKGGENVG